MSRNIAIIPARGGSKRIPRKNLKNFLGKPIIAYSIEAALNSQLFEEVMVSTDDEEIATLARKMGAVVPTLRSSENSNDFATTASVVLEVLNFYLNNQTVFDCCCCIYPTAPFITPATLSSAFDIFQKSQASALIPVVKFSYPIWRSLKVNDGRLLLNFPENRNARSQDLPPSYHDAGQFYFLNIEHFFKTHNIFSDNCIPYELQETDVHDIDNPVDWDMAELKYKLTKLNVRNH